jgi:serine/threonine protein kinase
MEKNIENFGQKINENINNSSNNIPFNSIPNNEQSIQTKYSGSVESYTIVDKNTDISSQNKINNNNIDKIEHLININNNYYELVSNNEFIGKGRFGNVYKYKMNNEKIVAVKIINKIKENITIKLEIDIMKKLNNKENIIQLIDFYENEDSYYIIMELCDCDLSQYLKENYPLNINLIQNIMKQIITGYNNLYEKDFQHLDLKLQNILVIYNNNNKDKNDITIKISDFGLVHQNNIRIYLDNFIGTIIYMSPEIIEKKEYSNKADIYSIGLIAYKLATNNYPFKNSEDRYLKEKLNINFDKIKENIKNDILFDFIKRCLEPDTSKRYEFTNFINSLLYVQRK